MRVRSWIEPLEGWHYGETYRRALDLVLLSKQGSIFAANVQKCIIRHLNYLEGFKVTDHFTIWLLFVALVSVMGGGQFE